MTKEQIIEKVRGDLDDEGITYYSSQDLFDAYDDGYEEVCVSTEVLERMDTISLIDDAVYYDFYNSFLDYKRVFAIWNPDINDWISHKGIDFFRRSRHDWEKANGSSYYFSVVGFEKIALYPHKQEAGSTVLDVFYKAVPRIPLDLSSVPEIPEHFQIVLYFYMMSDLLAQSEEFIKSTSFFNQYVDKKRQLRDYVNNRSFPDRIHMLREQFSGGSVYGR